MQNRVRGPITLDTLGYNKQYLTCARCAKKVRRRQFSFVSGDMKRSSVHKLCSEWLINVTIAYCSVLKGLVFEIPNTKQVRSL